MGFTSFKFLVFLFAVVVAYYIVPRRFQWALLLAASYGFYLSGGGVESLCYLLATTLFTYFSALWMQSLRDKNQKHILSLGEEITKDKARDMKKATAKKIHRIQVLTVLVNLGVLVLLKLINMAKQDPSFLGISPDMPLMNLIVPLGLSYYTFNSIGYLIDIGRGKYAAQRHIGKFALFTSFFPSIVQGPLCRFGDVGVQLGTPHAFSYKNLKHGAQLILWGFFKKIVIADRLAVITATIFSPTFTDYNGSQIFFGVLAYSFQIYGDFSGGTDIARGAAQMLGINLPMNFERPFFANSMGDFWRRWHMSLGAWMREYVFYPVMLSRPVTAVSKKFRLKWGPHAGKMVPSVAAPFVVFFLIGIWHGVTAQYITNGLYNAFLISGGVALGPVFQKLIQKLKIDTTTFSWRLFQILRTFTLLCISRIIVKAPSLGEGFRMIGAMFTSVDLGFITGADKVMFSYGLSETELSLIFVCVMVLFVVGILQENGVKIREGLDRQNFIFRWGLILLLFAAVLIFGVYGPGYNARDFIYGNF